MNNNEHEQSNLTEINFNNVEQINIAMDNGRVNAVQNRKGYKTSGNESGNDDSTGELIVLAILSIIILSLYCKYHNIILLSMIIVGAIVGLFGAYVVITNHNTTKKNYYNLVIMVLSLITISLNFWPSYFNYKFISNFSYNISTMGIIAAMTKSEEYIFVIFQILGVLVTFLLYIIILCDFLFEIACRKMQGKEKNFFWSYVVRVTGKIAIWNTAVRIIFFICGMIMVSGVLPLFIISIQK